MGHGRAAGKQQSRHLAAVVSAGDIFKKKNPESPGKLPGLSRAAFARILAGTVIFQVTSLSLANMFLNLYQI